MTQVWNWPVGSSTVHYPEVLPVLFLVNERVARRDAAMSNTGQASEIDLGAADDLDLMRRLEKRRRGDCVSEDIRFPGYTAFR